MAYDEHRSESGAHEAKRRGERTRRQARQATDAMAGGAAGTEAGTEADQKAGADERSPSGLDLNRRQDRDETVRHGSQHQADDEGDTPAGIAGGAWCQQAADDAADAGNSTLQSTRIAAATPIRRPPTAALPA